jgi:tetratricopeptide (TPR) repeat protein
MKKILVALFLFSCINLTFISLCPALQTENSPPRQIDSPSSEPLGCIFAQVATIKDPSFRCAALVDIANAYVELEGFDKAEYILGEATGAAQHIESQLVKSALISEIIDKFIKLNKNEVALGLTQYIHFTDSRTEMLVEIVSGYLRQNQYEKAVGLIPEINEPSFKALAFYRIIEKLTSEKLFAELAEIQKLVQRQAPSVQRFLRLILREENKSSEEAPVPNLFASKSPSKKTRALIALAKNKIVLGHPESTGQILAEAISLSETIKGEYIKNECLAQIGICFVQMGELEKARSLAQIIKIPFSRAELLASVSTGLVEIKEFDAALRVAGDIDVQCFKEKALAQIIIGHLKQGEKKQADEIIEKLESASVRSRIYVIIIKSYLQNKNYSAALATSKKIEDLEIKTQALIEIAKELQKKRLFSGQLRQAFLESLGLSRY